MSTVELKKIHRATAKCWKVCKEENEKKKSVYTNLTSADFLLIYKETELDQCFHPDIILESPVELKK